MIAQWGVVIGVWVCLLVDVLGNYAGQGGDEWLYIIVGTASVLVFVIAAAVRALLPSPDLFCRLAVISPPATQCDLRDQALGQV